jgi:tetratricopeptide (TPR) repeat protein
MNPEHAIRAGSRPVLATACFALLMVLLVPAAGRAQSADPDFGQKLAMAEGFHDLAILYIKKGDLDNAAASARQIIKLRFPAEEEYRISKSLSIITEKLSEISRFDLAQLLLDEALKITELDANKANLYRTKARMFYKAGQDEKAIDAWRRALDLEARKPR